MWYSSPRPTAVLLNLDASLRPLLELLVGLEGLQLVVPAVAEADDAQWLQAFLFEHQPAVVIYGVAPPYREQWAAFRTLRESVAARGRQFIVLTTDSWALAERQGQRDPFALLGLPFEMDELIEAIRHSFAASNRRSSLAPADR